MNKSLFSKGFVKYFSNSAWLMGEKVLRIFSELFIGIYIARILGPEKFGIYSYVIALITFLYTISKLGMDNIIIRNTVNEPSKGVTLISTSFFIRLISSSLLITLLVLGISFIPGIDNSKYIILTSLVVIFQSFDVISLFFHAKVKGKIISICLTLQLVISSILKVIAIVKDPQLHWFLIIYFFEKLILSIFYFCAFYKYHGNHIFKKFNFVTAQNILTKSWPLLLSGIAIVVYMRLDQIMIKSMLGDSKVGIYSAGIKIAESWFFIPMILTSSVFPAILNAKKRSIELYKNRLQSLYDFLFLLSFSIAVIFSFFSEEIIMLFFGDDYIGSSKILSLSIWSGIFVSWGIARGKWMLAEDLQRYSPIYVISGALVNVILNLILIPIYGIIGASVATVFAQATVAIIAPFFVKQTRISVYNLLYSTTAILRLNKIKNSIR